MEAWIAQQLAALGAAWFSTTDSLTDAEKWQALGVAYDVAALMTGLWILGG